MDINKKTMLFEDLSNTERAEMRDVVEGIVLRGIPPQRGQYAWLEAWVTAFGFTDDQWWLLVSTAFPQRALLSLLIHEEIEHDSLLRSQPAK